MIKTVLSIMTLITLLHADEAQMISQGKQVADTLLKTLGSNLKQQIKTNGLVGAATFCNVQAMPLTKAVSEQYANISVRRIALKNRNATNAPNAVERPVLEALQQLETNRATLPTHILQKTDTGYLYYQPIRINKGVCLACHGTLTPKSELAAFITQQYPHDKATGFKMGDLRGFFVVEFHTDASK